MSQSLSRERQETARFRFYVSHTRDDRNYTCTVNDAKATPHVVARFKLAIEAEMFLGSLRAQYIAGIERLGDEAGR